MLVLRMEHSLKRVLENLKDYEVFCPVYPYDLRGSRVRWNVRVYRYAKKKR